MLTFLFLDGSCTKSGMSHSRDSKNEYGYKIVSETQAHELFRKIRSQNGDIEIIQQFFLNKSFYLKSVEALTQGSRVACIAIYRARGDSERLGILAIKLQGDALVETTAGILWIERGFPNEIEGPKLASRSTTSLCGWWSCMFSDRHYRTIPRYYNPYDSSRLPWVYWWFRRCY